MPNNGSKQKFVGNLADIRLKFCLIGNKGSGKTRLLSIIAKRAVGGLLNSQIGTRCPVVYRFQESHHVECLLGLNSDSMQSVDINGVRGYIESHMAQISKTESGYSSKPLFVTIMEPNAVSLVTLIDLPGFHPSDQATNRLVRKMAHNYTSLPFCYPVVVANFPSDLLPERFEADLKSIFPAMNSSLLSSFIFVSRLECVRQFLDQTRLDLFKEVVRKFGFNVDDRLVFMSMVPELLDGQSRSLCKNSTPSDQLSEYFSKTIFEKEEELLPSTIANIMLKPGADFKIGLDAALNLITLTLIEALSDHIELEVGQLKDVEVVENEDTKSASGSDGEILLDKRRNELDERLAEFRSLREAFISTTRQEIAEIGASEAGLTSENLVVSPDLPKSLAESAKSAIHKSVQSLTVLTEHHANAHQESDHNDGEFFFDSSTSDDESSSVISNDEAKATKKTTRIPRLLAMCYGMGGLRKKKSTTK